MKASEFEFRHRSVLNLIHFWMAFQLYSVDHRNVVSALVSGSDHRVLLLRVVFGFGALLVALAAAMRTWAAAYLRSSVVHDPRLHTEALVADGPYRHVRNPLYLGTFLMSIGLGLLASRSGFVVLAAGAAMRILRLIGREEAELAAQQGDAFQEFCRRVPRLWPSLDARLPASGAKPEWSQAFAGEAHMWGFFLTMLAFAITLDRSVLWILGGASLGLWLLGRVLQRLKPAAA
jgi:protein-S-isoprenylcysteine O-methyltransferase Ste14